VSVEAPPRPPEQDELDALIEEARRRARRRRLAYISLLAAAALAAAGSYLLIGGGSDRGSPVSPRGEPGADATAGPEPSRAARAYHCPTTIAGLRRSSPTRDLPGCRIHFWATLPPGWREVPKRGTAFPRSVPQIVGLAAVRFANFPLHPLLTERPPSVMPHPLPPDGIAVVISAKGPPERGSRPIHPPDLRPGDFDAVGSSGMLSAANIATGGWLFRVLVRTGTDRDQNESLAEATTVVNSIVTTEHLCPCGARSHRG
jgi:hypothetical protein